MALTFVDRSINGLKPKHLIRKTIPGELFEGDNKWKVVSGEALIDFNCKSHN